MIRKSLCTLIMLVSMAPTIVSAFSMPLSQEQIEFKMPLSQDITKTQFTQIMYAEYQSNGVVEQYQMKGVPFLYQSTTYVPLRDISEAFGIQVTYNELDRFVILQTNDRAMFISPNMTNIGRFTTYYQIGDFSPSNGIVTYKSNKMDDRRNDSVGAVEGYIGINDRSYVPIRVILEFFDFDVNYDKISKTITITGNKLQGSSYDSIFSSEHSKIIQAMSSYEAALTATYEGTWFGEENAKAVMQKSITAMKVSSIYTVTESNGQKYETTNFAEAIKINGIAYPIVGGQGGNVEKQGIRMNGPHPLCVIGETYLSGSNKYKEMKISKTNETETTELYAISNLEGTEVNLLIEIEKGSGKLYRYTESRDGEEKSFVVKY